MTRPLTSEEAIELLRKNPENYATPETLRSLAAQVDADAAGKLTVLYSGPAANGVWSTQVIDAMVDAGEDVRVINKSEAAKFLTSRDFYHSLASAYGLDDFRPLADGSYRGPATAWLYHPEHGPWADASGRFADATKGEVVAIVGDADPGRVFGKVEVPHILANPNVTTIEGIPRETLSAMSKPGDTQAAFEMIVARAREHGGQLRVAVPDAINYRGQLLYDKSGVLKVDSREYFEGTAIEGRSPAFEGETRALSGNMNSPTAHATAGQERVEAWQRDTLHAQQTALAEDAQRATSRLRGTAAGAALYGVTEAYAWNETRQRANVFEQTLHNKTAAQDAYVQQGAQTAGGLAGTAAGVTTAAVLNTGTGGTAALVVADGYLFGKAAEHGVEVWQKQQVYNITSEGVDWTFNGKQWIREDLRADLVDDGRDLLQQQDFAAPPDKARELSARASAVAVEQALEKVPTPRDPFVQPANDSDAYSLRPRPWTYRADSGTWVREVVLDVDVHERPNNVRVDEAGPERATQLSAQAQRTIDQNLAAGPAEIAAAYQTGHKAHGYDQTPAGAMSDAVTTALSPDLLQASDGKHYRRDAQGEWAHEGKAADPQRALELEVTRDRLLPALADHEQQLARMPSWQPPTPEEQDKTFLREAYLNRGINREAVPENFEASYLAVQRTRAETGVTAASLVLGQDANGQFTPDSPIHHIRFDANGEIRIAATTTPEDIAKALTDVRAHGRGEDMSQPVSPEHAISQTTQQERDAREQAQREANRQGLSQDDTQQVVHAATRDVAAQGITTAEPEHASAPSTPAQDDANALRLGDRGDAVELLQFRLDRQGYRDANGQPLPQDGQYGPETERAVKQFQQDHALPATGVADERTQFEVTQPRGRNVQPEGGEREATAQQEDPPTATQAPPTTPTDAPPPPTADDITQEGHPGHARYQQALNAIERSPNIPPGIFAGERLQQAAANLAHTSLAAAERPQGGPNERLDRIDFVVFNNDRSGLIAGQGGLGDPLAKLALLPAAQDNATTLTDASRLTQDTLVQQQMLAQQQPPPTLDNPTPDGPVPKGPKV